MTGLHRAFVIAAAVAPAAAPPAPLLPCANISTAEECGVRCRPLCLTNSTPKECLPLRNHTFEVTAYHSCGAYEAQGSEWQLIDWDRVTSVAEFCAETHEERSYWQMVCTAHERGVRVINWMDGPVSQMNEQKDFPVERLQNRTAVDAWAALSVATTMQL